MILRHRAAEQPSFGDFHSLRGSTRHGYLFNTVWFLGGMYYRTFITALY
jgi:hypothetical protein